MAIKQTTKTTTGFTATLLTEFTKKFPKSLFAYPTVNMPFFCLDSLLSGPDSDAHSDGLGSRYRH